MIYLIDTNVISELRKHRPAVAQIVRAGPEIEPVVIDGEAEGLGRGLIGCGPCSAATQGRTSSLGKRRFRAQLNRPQV
ncbi:MAG: hypothetical protein CGW95_06120 [Phenylobacterium zucineum]|nr:MAG: hypothetical protein CGW95_06120 [Phenylobacterium zucineum]